MIKYIYILLTLFLMSTQLFAQKPGFMGKRHQISYDVADMLLDIKHEIAYDYVAGENMGLQFAYHFNSSEYTGLVGTNSLSGFQMTGLPGKMEVSGSGFTLGMKFSSFLTGMSLPFGYYWGFHYERNSSTFTESYSGFKEPSTSSNFYQEVVAEKGFGMIDTTLKFSDTRVKHFLKISYGFNTYLAANLTLDISLHLGAGLMFTNDELDNAKPNGGASVPGHDPAHNLWGNSVNSSGYYESPFMLYFLPKIKIGYLF